MHDLANKIRQWGFELGFQQIGITDTDLSTYESRFSAWLAQGHHGAMDYMEKHGVKRTRPAELHPGTLRVISARMDYLPPDTRMLEMLQDPDKAYISRYALGRDYHRLIRRRLQALANHISQEINNPDHRVFCDSAPVLEKAIAEKAGLGWIGKHTNVINTKAGSWFFLGEIYTNIPLPTDTPQARNHCGSCTACITICPTQAIIAPYQLDARRCISYLTIEWRGAIPLEFRPLMGNRIYGCDDCQIICPWNKFAKYTGEREFHPRHQLDTADLLKLFVWTEEEFLRYTEGSAIRRIGHECWQRNIAVALGNASYSEQLVATLRAQLTQATPLVREHIEWALFRHSR